MKKKVLILSGPTHEYIDPVRFVGNASSGKMGAALANEALRLGFDVDFVTGPVSEENLPSTSIYRVTSAQEMLAQADLLFDTADVIIFAAAVSDYAPVERKEEKMAKSSDDLVLHLTPTPDIAKTLCRRKRNDQIAFGFALQTSDGILNAQRKLNEKKLDGIILNTPATLGSATGTFTYLTESTVDPWGLLTKEACAKQICALFSVG